MTGFADYTTLFIYVFFFFKQKTAYEIAQCLVGSEMCIRDRLPGYLSNPLAAGWSWQGQGAIDICSPP